jgi:hypothetical protein
MKRRDLSLKSRLRRLHVSISGMQLSISGRQGRNLSFERGLQ